MAKRPVKKRKPRKVVKPKRKARSRIQPKAVGPKPFEPIFNLAIGAPDDPFYIDPPSVPRGVALQWIATHVMGHADYLFYEQALDSGWKPVKAEKPVGGQILMWAPRELADAQRDANIKKAKDQLAEVRQLFQMDAAGRSEGRRIPLVSESFVVSSVYERVPNDTPPIDVEVKVKFRLPYWLQDAANSLGLTPEVYAQRRMDLYIRGELGGILLPASDTSLELHERGNFNIASRI